MAKGGINPVMPWHSFNNLTGYFGRHNNKESCVRVSVRLKQSLWASALIVSTIVIQSPSSAFSQTQSPVENSTAIAGSGLNTFAVQQMETDEVKLATARSALLQARQALAKSDVATAKQMLETAKSIDIDFARIGDTPETVQSMIDRQLQLEELRQRNEHEAFNAGAASFLLTQSEALMHYQDYETAETLVNTAKSFPVQFNTTIGNPDELLNMIAAAKATQAAKGQLPVAQMAPTAQSLKYLSEAQLAFDQGKLAEASELVNQAKKLNVPDTALAANAPRPWQLEMKIQNAMNRQSFDPAVIQASFDNKTNGVINTLYDPSTDASRNIAASAVDGETTNFNPIPRTAQDFYQAGLEAMVSKNYADARIYFERAWNNRAELDPKSIQAIQDQLTLLTMSKPIPVAGLGNGPVRQVAQTIDLNDASSQQTATFKQLQSQIFKERADAERMLESDPRSAVEKMTMLRGRVVQSKLDVTNQTPLLTIIDRDLAEMQSYIDRNLPEIMNDETNAERLDKVDMRRQKMVDDSTQLQKLVEDFNTLIDEQRFPEAQVVARQAADLAPNSPLVAVLTEKATLLRRLDRMNQIKTDKEEGFWAAMANAERASAGIDDETPFKINDPELWTKNSNRRLGRMEENRYNSEADRQIWNTLRNERVQGEYRGTLAEAVDQLARQAAVNIVFDDIALAAENVQKDRMVDIPIREPISLRSALEVILNSAGLVFVVENEVIKVTSRNASTTKLMTQTYYIGDLVMPVTAPQNPNQMHWMQPNMASGGSPGFMNVSTNGASVSEVALSQRMGREGLLDGAVAGAMYNANNGPARGQPTYGTVGNQPLGGVSEQDFQPLIDLIQNTIQPDTWQDTGQGLGTLQAFVPNLSLIVSQSQEVQDEIQDLLKKLRELNDVQIVVEVRFVSLRDEFFERVGIDFDFSINDNNPGGDPTADTVSGSRVVGREPTDTVDFTPTSDLDLRFVQNSFSAAEPIFGGFQAAQAANFGFAILSDIEVFFLIQAAKGDTRTNITQAPTVTMFNGQSASVTDGASRPFVTSVIPVVGDFAVAHQPVITILPDGTNLNVTAVVSDDRRFVRLQLVPFFTQVTDVTTFTFDGSTTTEQSSTSVLDNLLEAVEGGSRSEEDETERTTTQGITVQLPVLAQTSVNTVVSVPDGGTVLMGGIKRMNESRTERGVPFLSNVPYVNRLFKNVGIGHETQNLMMMVTPRIIIQDEIEEDQVGIIETD
jgi:general secretion pathway protein D